MKTVLTLAFATCGVVTALQAQTAAPAFEVASIKTNRSGAVAQRISAPRGTGRFEVTNGSLYILVLNAYGLADFQLAGGPDWMRQTRFDIAARGDMSATREQIAGMLRDLLADRFHLVTHRETREQPVYALVMARPDGRPGPRLKATTRDCLALTAGRADQPPPTADGQTLCGTTMTPNAINGGARTLDQVAKELTGVVGRQVINETGLPGLFDLDLTFTAEMPERPGAPPAPAGDPDAPSIFAAVQEQLGLKLEARRAPVEVLVIDRVDLPDEN